MKFTILRVSYRPDGTFGVIFCGDLPFALTLEREWKNNERNLSCIPVGEYVCRRVKLPPRFPNTFQVMDVPDRDGILIHRGNLMEHSRGCILVGEQFDVLGNHCAVTASDKGFEEFMLRASSVDEFDLSIISAK